MGFNFYLEKHTAMRASQRTASNEEKHVTNQASTRLSVHYEPPALPRSEKGRRKASLKSRTVRYLKSIWGKVTGENRTTRSASVRHSIQRPVRISNPLRSTVTSLALASFDDLKDAGHSKMAEDGHTSIPITIDGTIVDHIRLPTVVASRIIGATFSADTRSIQLTTQTPPSYEQAHVQPRHQPFKVCQIFGNETLEFATSALSSAESLIIWPAPNNLYSLSPGHPPSAGAIHRNVRMAPGNMIQIPSMHNAQDTYMLAYENSDIYLGPPMASVPSSTPRLFVAAAQAGSESPNRIVTSCRAFVLTDTT